MVAAWILFNLALFLLFCGALILRAQSERVVALASLKAAAVTLSGSYGDQLSRAVATIDDYTVLLKYHWEQERSLVDLEGKWHAGLFGFKHINGIAIADKNGRLITNTFPSILPSDISPMPFFRAYKNNARAGLQIVAPAKDLGTSRSMIRFVRDLRNRDGEFDGIVAVGCPPSYFASSSGKSRLGQRDYLTMRTLDGTVYVRQTHDAIGAAETIFSRPRQLAEGYGLEEMAGAEFKDGLPRYVAWSPVQNTGMVALAALSVDDALQEYRLRKQEYARWSMAWMLFLFAVCIAGLVLYGRLLIRGHDADRIMRTYRLATEGAGEGFYMLEPVRGQDGTVVDFRILDCNALGAKFLAFDTSGLIGKTIADLHPGPYGKKLVSLFMRALEKGYDEAEARVPAPSRYSAEWIHRKMVSTEGGLAVTVIDISTRKQQEKALRELANTDALTGLPNRLWLNGYLPQATAKADRDKSTIALYFIDLDNFKDINDTLGHHAGDLVLRATAERLRAAVRPQDKVVRLGGDEFTVMVEDVNGVAGARQVAERIVEELTRPVALDGHSLSQMGGSVGISLYPIDATDADTLLRHADTAMYVAKTNGKTCFAFFSNEIGRLRASRLEMERELREAVLQGRFVMHYQPRVDVKNGRVVGAEALVRWRHPTRGLIAPTEFISVAEQTGIILDLGEIVIDLVCSQIAQWQKEQLPPVPVSINVSPIQFNRRDVAAFLIGRIAHHGIPFELLEIELTEAAMLESTAVRKQFDQLAQHGINLLVDDFGTGYSSVAQMQHFNLDVLKVDQSLTKKLGIRPQARVFYEAIIAMGHALNMTITAEGVETDEQLDILAELRCDQIQGFIIARPLSANSFQHFLREYERGAFRNRLTRRTAT